MGARAPLPWCAGSGLDEGRGGDGRGGELEAHAKG